MAGYAGNYSWIPTTGNWAAISQWAGGVAPTGLDSTDVLTFGGNVSPPYVSTNNIVATPFLLNRLVSDVTDPSATGSSHTIAGGALRFTGVNPSIAINGNGSLNLNTGVDLPKALTIGGTGSGRVTINGAISGFSDITKTGTSTLRFGTLPPGVGLTAPSMNTWMGRLILSDGTVQFNNNAQSGSTALRANPVVLSTGTTLLLKRNHSDEADGVDTSLRIGTLSGAGGTVTARVVDESNNQTSNVSNYDIVITALSDGTFAGTLNLEPQVRQGNDGGKLIIRGTNTQTFTGTLNITKDVQVGYGATMKLAGAATLSGQSGGALVLTGGTVILDNSGGNVANGRLRDGAAGSTGVETIGGGKLTLIGHASGSSELVSRLQLGTASNGLNRPRAGVLDVNVVHTAGASAATELRFQSYLRREELGFHYTTVNFTAQNSAGTPMTLGLSGNNPRVYLTNGGFNVLLFNGLLNVTAGSNTNSVGWATVNGESFASYNDLTGVTAVVPTAWPAGESDNALVTGNVSTSSSDTNVNTIKFAPTAAGQSMNITGSGNLSSAAYLLAGGIDYVLRSTGGGGLGGSKTRFFYVQQAKLTVEATVAPAFNITENRGVVKSGAGVLELTNSTNASLTAPLVINEGAVRANHTTGALPGGEIQLRGGVLELAGGGTFSRTLGAPIVPQTPWINWSGVTTTSSAGDDDRGSGGFAAVGADATVNLSSNLSQISWEDSGFLRSGYALVLGSKTATHRITWSNNLGLTDANSSSANYNAREIRVVDNPNTTGDSGRITGAISGGLHNDLLKTGNGTLELAHATANTYLGATIVQEGTLLVNTNNEASFAHVVKGNATLGGNGRLGNVRLEAGGILSPGNLLGRTSILQMKDLTAADGTAKLVLELGGTVAGGNSTTGYDQLKVTGRLDLNGMDLDLQQLGGFVASAQDLFFLIINDGIAPVEGQFADGSIVMMNGQQFNISYTANSDLGQFDGGNDVAIRAVPEPATCLFLGLGLAVGLGRRRRGSR